MDTLWGRSPDPEGPGLEEASPVSVEMARPPPAYLQVVSITATPMDEADHTAERGRDEESESEMELKWRDRKRECGNLRGQSSCKTAEVDPSWAAHGVLPQHVLSSELACTS